MSSIQASFAQNKSRSLVVFSTNAYFTTDAQLATLLLPASNVGSVSTFPTDATFYTFTNGLGAAFSAANETLIDLGNEVNVGIAGVGSTLVKLRRVQRTTGGNVVTGYVVTENDVSKYSVLYSSAKAVVGVARV